MGGKSTRIGGKSLNPKDAAMLKLFDMLRGRRANRDNLYILKRPVSFKELRRNEKSIWGITSTAVNKRSFDAIGSDEIFQFLENGGMGSFQIMGIYLT